MINDMTPEVQAISALNFEGNIIPIEWYTHLRLANNKPDLISIVLLSDFIYWYRPSTVREERTGRIIGYYKKFKSDLLQKSYAELSNFYGFGKDQIRDSLLRLEKRQLVKRVFRNVISQGNLLANVMFIQIFPERIANITEKAICTRIFPNTTSEVSDVVVGPDPQPYRVNHHTNTETTTKNNSIKKNLSKKALNDSNFLLEKDMIKIWNDFIEGEQIIKFTNSRGLKLNKVFKIHCNENIENWEMFCKKIVSSKFLMGEINGFKVQFDWAIKEEIIVKILENAYGVGDRLVQESKISNINPIEILINPNDNDILKNIKKDLLNKYGIPVFKSWFKDLELKSIFQEIITVYVTSEFKKSYITDNYLDYMQKALEKIVNNGQLIVHVKPK